MGPRFNETLPYFFKMSEYLPATDRNFYKAIDEGKTCLRQNLLEDCLIIVYNWTCLKFFTSSLREFLVRLMLLVLLVIFLQSMLLILFACLLFCIIL